LTFLAPTAGASVQLTSWDALRVRSLASVALLGCLLVGSAVRLYRISWLKQLTIVWLTTLALLIWGAPAPWAVICGGMLSGSLLSVLVPRRWMEKRDFLARAPARLQAAAAALAVLNIGAGSGVRAEPLSPSPPGLPDVLISAARYELGEAGAVPHLKATFTVLLQPAHAEQFLRLPFQDVVFDAQAECLLDGVRQPLLPAIGGDAVLVRLPSTDFTATATQWQRHALQIDFLIRPQTADAAQATWRAGIPAVLDSTLIVPPGQTAPPLVRRGAIVPGAEGRQVLSLGGLGRLATEPNGTSPPADATAVSLLDVSPLRISGSTRIVLDPASRSARLSLAFPPDCLINSVTGASVLDWIELPSVAEQPAFLVRLRTDAPPAPISISFDLPGQNVQGPDVNLPAFRLWGGPAVSHAIGLSGPPAAAFALANSSGIATLTPEEWQAVSEPGRPRPPLAIQLKSPQAVALQWSWLTPQRTSAISETVSVRRDGLDWSAAVRVTVAQAAAFKHQFRLDARVRVDGVTDGENGQESPLRFVRTGDLLTVFLPGGQLGEKILTMTGRTPLSPDAWSPLPALEPLESAVSESQLTIRDETGWDLEMETAGGAKLQAAAPDVASPAAPRGGSRVASIFRKGTARPVKLRASPPAHAIRSESALLLQTPEKGDWELSASFWLSSADAPLRTASFLLPRELANVRVRPGTLKAALTPDELGTRVTVGIPERSAGGVALTLSARISPELKARLLSAGGSEASAALPVPVCTSAQRGVQWVLIRPDSPLTVSPAAAVQAAAATLPPGVPAEWQRALADKSLNCFQQTRPDLSVSLKASPAASGRPRVRLNETCLWPLANGELRGLTRLSLVVQGADSLRLSHPEDAHVDLVCAADEGPLAWKAVRGGTQIQLPQGAEAVICEVHWRRPEARGMLRLLEVDAEKPDQRLAVVIQPADWLLDRGSAAVVTELDGWLVRWQALLGCLTDVQKPLPSDGALLRRLRLCQAQVERLLAVGGERVDAEHRGRAAQLAAEWSRRTDQLALSGAGPTAAPFAAAELDAFDQLSAGLSVVWLAPEGRNWTGRSAAPVAQHQQERMIWSAALVLASLIGAWLLSRQLNWTREFLAQRPTLGLTLLGLFWWAFLTPSPLGLAIIAGAWLGWAAAALARLAGRWLPALSGS
jgi:hypothetical protein